MHPQILGEGFGITRERIAGCKTGGVGHIALIGVDVFQPQAELSGEPMFDAAAHFITIEGMAEGAGLVIAAARRDVGGKVSLGPAVAASGIKQRIAGSEAKPSLPLMP